ncbi:MAG: nucleotidyltransferase domain-containing protein [Candidatus Latescibacterota bacterium]
MVQTTAPSPALVAAWQQRFARERAALAGEEERAHAQAEQCALLLVRAFGASRVYLFGSLCTPQRLHRHSDIDLAASGVPPAQYLTALDALSRIAERGVDLVRLEDATADMVRYITENGTVLHERTQVRPADR